MHRVLAGGDGWKVRRRELHEPVVGKVHDRTVVAVAILLRADALHRLQNRILPVPQVHTARLRRALDPYLS